MSFNKAFAPDEPVKLILKTVVDKPYQRFPIDDTRYPNIKIIEGKISEAEMSKLMAESDCFVFPMELNHAANEPVT